MMNELQTNISVKDPYLRNSNICLLRTSDCILSILHFLV